MEGFCLPLIYKIQDKSQELEGRKKENVWDSRCNPQGPLLLPMNAKQSIHRLENGSLLLRETPTWEKAQYSTALQGSISTRETGLARP